ncbi:MAG: right-handed parallel beta-helix repeat-containing protein, partial [Spartobacteria bacterium]|nr:right-handed parallel beta-helix repeat-containing protein [Spartobacteria bacterium]
MGSFLHLVTNTVTVPSGITLTIEPGAVVKFLNYDNMLIQNGGRLLVDAHPATPVYFTSFKDDSVGGDANNDGDATTPAAGDWRWIQLDNGRADLNHAIFKYGGGTYNGSWDGTAVLRASGGNARLNASNCIIRDAFFDGIEVWDGAGLVVNCVLDGIDRAVCAQPNGQLTVRNCTIHNNRIGILVHGGTMDVANSLITDSLENGVQYDMGALASFRYNNVYNSGSSNYVGLADLTSTDGNVSADPLYRDAAAYDYRLSAHSPAIDAADTPLAPTNDFIGAPRVTDPTAPHPGIPGPGGEYADMGAYEYTETAPSGIDLIVTQVAGPTSVLAGALVEVHWTVQ